MALFSCGCNDNNGCTVAGIVVSAIIGVIAAFLQITAVITVAPVFLWVVFGIAVAYLAILFVAVLLSRRTNERGCFCGALNTVLAGVLGGILVSLVLLAVGIVATSVISAILVGLVVFFFALIFVGSACLVRCITNCGE